MVITLLCEGMVRKGISGALADVYLKIDSYYLTTRTIDKFSGILCYS